MPEDVQLLALIERHRPKPRKRGVETSLLSAILKRVGYMPLVRLFRNNVGTLRDARGGYVTYGLCVGSSDLIGYKTVTITQEMVGQQIAQFVAIEGKTPKGQQTDRQALFLEQCKAAGAVAVCVRSVEEAEKALR